MTLTSSLFFVLAQLTADAPHVCDPCEEWNQPQEPFRVHGSTWFVGTAGLGAILITSKDGHVLIDGGLPQSAPLIAANIEKAGFRLGDIKLILNSHTHYDHAGGIAALQRASGAEVAASPPARLALQRGGPTPDDPQFGFGSTHNDYAPVATVRGIRDGEVLRVGSLALTAHFTPGHTPGGTSWTWRDCQDGRCLDLVYADSLNAVSAPDFRFSESGRARLLETSMAVVAALPCDILLAPHPVLIDMPSRLARWKADPTVNAFVDTAACRQYAAAARQRLQARLAEEGPATQGKLSSP
jgi:metallo-beta-lactamase class B